MDVPQYVVNVKSMVKILSVYVAFLENMNFSISRFWDLNFLFLMDFPNF